MVMGGQKGYPVKCEKCGHEDAIIFHQYGNPLKELVFKLVGRKCPECGGKMTIDPGKVIRF